MKKSVPPRQLIPLLNETTSAFKTEELEEVRQKIAQHQEQILKAANDITGPNAALALQLTERMHLLLNNYSGLTAERQKLVTAAIHYFLQPKDAVPDHTPVTGFDDDAAVTNYVLECLGHKNLKIEI